MKTKHEIKRITLTIEEICQLVSGAGVGSCEDMVNAITEAAKAPESVEPKSMDDSPLRMILDKIQEKSRRLRAQREKRLLRRQQKQEESKAADNAADPEPSSSAQPDVHPTGPDSAVAEKVSIILTNEFQEAASKFFNLCLHQRSVVRQFVKQLSPYFAKTEIDRFVRTINLFFSISKQYVLTLKEWRHSYGKHSRPTRLHVNLSPDDVPDLLKFYQ